MNTDSRGCLDFGIWILGFSLALTACGTPTPPTPVALRIDTTDLALPLVQDLAAAYATVQPGVVIAPNLVALPVIPEALAAGAADLALTGQPSPDLFATPLAYASFTVVVNPANSVSSLSAAQLLEVFTGRINDWGQLGGPAGGIQVVSREKGSDAEIAFGASALSGASPALTALVAPTWEAMRQLVGQNPNTIGYLPAVEVEASVKSVGLDTPLRVLIAAVAAQQPRGAALDFLLWAQSAEGQQAAAQRYVPYP